MERSRWLCLQHRLLQAEKGLLLDTSSKGRRPKVGGAFCGPKSQRIDTGCVITSNVFVGGNFLDLGLLWKDRKRRRGSGSTFWNNQRRRNWASAAAGARFGTSGSPKMRPAPQREQHFEKKHRAKTHLVGTLCVKKTVRGGVPNIFRTPSGEVGEYFHIV